MLMTESKHQGNTMVRRVRSEHYWCWRSGGNNGMRQRCELIAVAEMGYGLCLFVFLTCLIFHWAGRISWIWEKSPVPRWESDQSHIFFRTRGCLVICGPGQGVWALPFQDRSWPILILIVRTCYSICPTIKFYPGYLVPLNRHPGKVTYMQTFSN